MKQILFLTLTLLALNSSFGQDDNDYHTVGENFDIRLSGFGAPIMSFTQIDGNFVHMMGGGAGLIINNFFLGAYGIGNTTQIDFPNDASSNLNFAHAGLWLGYSHNPNKAVHPVFHTMVGWGGVLKSPKDYDENSDNEVLDQLFIVCPTIEMEFNFSRFFKFGAGVNYTIAYGADNIPYSDADFTYPGVFLSFKFGWFK